MLVDAVMQEDYDNGNNYENLYSPYYAKWKEKVEDREAWRH